MPYKPDGSDAPEYVPRQYRRKWAKVWNSAYEYARGQGKSKEEAESYAYAVANSRFGPGGENVKEMMYNYVEASKSDMQEVTEAIVEKQIFMPILKVDASKRLVSGVLTAEEPDLDGEILDYEKSKPYFQQWSEMQMKATMDPNNPSRLSLGNVREMHNPHLAAGKLVELTFDDAAKRIYGTAYVSDDSTWKKCQDGTLTGFSIGGRYIGGKPVKGGKYVAMPIEVSLVDKPCLPSATFVYVKADGSIELRKFAPREESERKEEAMLPSENENTLAQAEKIAEAILERLKKDHETFQVLQGGIRHPQLAGRGEGGIVDVTGQAYRDTSNTVGPRCGDPFDPEELFVQDISVGVSKEPCPCEDCESERAELARVTLYFDRLFGDDGPAKLAELMQKAEETQDYATRDGKKVPRSKHAWAPEGTGPSEWKYPIDTPSRVRNALARWGQHKGIPKDEEPKVARRILAAARRFGIEVDPDSQIVRDAKRDSGKSANLTSRNDTDNINSVKETAMEVEKKKDKEKDKAPEFVDKRKLRKEAMEACDMAGKAVKEHSEFLGKCFDKIAKALAHGEDEQGVPRDLEDPAREHDAVGADPVVHEQKPAQIPAAESQPWAKAVADLDSKIDRLTEQLAALAEKLSKAAEAKVESKIEEKPAVKVVGDRDRVVDRRPLTESGRAQLESVLKAVMGAEEKKDMFDPSTIFGKSLDNLNARDAREIRDALENPELRLRIMREVKPVEGGIDRLPATVQKALGARFGSRLGR